MSDEEVYCRRVSNPDPLRLALARQVVDQLEAFAREGLVVQPSTLIKLASEAGVPVDYVLDERERRVRERRLSD